jgi:hypothetical protein
VTIPGDSANTGSSNGRPNLVQSPTSNCGSGHLTNCINVGAFATPAQYTYGSAGRNILFGPGFSNLDFSLFKNFSIQEKAKVQFRAEAFNLLNTPAFSNPNATLSDPVNGVYQQDSNFGSITSTAHNNRQIQFALKLLF